MLSCDAVIKIKSHGRTINEICADENSDHEFVFSESEQVDNATAECVQLDSDDESPNVSMDVDSSTSWTTTDIKPEILPFNESPGIKIDLSQMNNPFEWLKIFLDDNLIESIATETNRYAHQQLRMAELLPHSRDRDYKDVSKDEMWIYIGILFMTGIDKRPEIDNYWSTKSVFLTPWYGQRMSIRRFQQISKFLHFADNESRPLDCKDRLYKVRPVLNSIVNRFQEVYIPEKQISIAEAIIGWKDRLVFTTYMPDKPDKYGMKVYLVCESQSGYIWNMEAHTGKSQRIENLVLHLLGDRLLNKGYHLYHNNYYNNVRLSEMLLQKNTYVCGTFHLTKGIPKELEERTKYLRKGESSFVRKGQVLVQMWRDKRDMQVISTLHTASIVDTGKKDKKGESIRKPEAIHDYNKYMRDVDKTDQMLHYYPCCKKTVKWTKKFVLFLLQMAALNSFLLLKKFTKNDKQRTMRYGFKDFILDCVQEMTSRREENDNVDEDSLSTLTPTIPPRKRPPMSDPAIRLEGGLKLHKMIHVPPSEKKQHSAMRKCRVCSVHKKRKETSTMCSTCGVGLCKTPCFFDYHTKKKY